MSALDPAPFLTPSPWFDQLRVVLVRSRNPLNIGAAARAMSNFGFTTLRLVTPWEPSYLGARSAVGASQVLLNAQVFKSVAEAVSDCGLVVGTSAVGERELHHPLHALQAGAELMRGQLPLAPAALLFGSEKFGLSNHDLAHCHWLMRIPTRDLHHSMNLGQAVAVCLYELSRCDSSPQQAKRGLARDPASPGLKLANRSGEASHGPAHPSSVGDPAIAADVERLTQLLFASLRASGYMQPAAENAALDKLRTMLRRMNLNKHDTELWLGMLRQILWKLGHNTSGPVIGKN